MRRGELGRPSDKSGLIERLKQSAEYPNAPFATYRDLFVFAACLGYEQGQRVPPVKTELPIPWEVLTGRNDFEGLLYLFGIASGDTTLLAEERTQELLKLFEAYCNGGLEIIEDWLNVASGMTETEVISTHVLSHLEKLDVGLGEVVEKLLIPDL